ncbi:hypothetical protein VITU102760_12205 [Vibrio tubiashii]|uniref:Uncharacterized protein n=1 Tax=Vibrio tubiashii ATCC 19109 TaxID=1051646 RepID=F9SZY3_9VIBR|nr:hypothetical protein [Vibrio tubiashii]AIW16287.1 hypothetical protein IX91_19530 [Vibrio tubiashii ATCC 19109]EGU59061.1 hypothetical protein VITU9109_18945 [Vibrio tubiashii ATCC 19109]EIF05936.1 hypothetical protein VT1337_00810 [Vibrio tubiashii NCIMB 1337 = ATCC 19106]
MSLWDDLGNFGSGMLDSVGEGFDNLVKTATTQEQQTVNPGTTSQLDKQADNHGNKVTPLPQPTEDKTLLYVGLGVGTVLSVGLLIVLAKS